MEFALKKGVSLSTLRRYIKSHRVQYQMVKGKYLILDDGRPPESSVVSNQTQLDEDLRKAKEEIAELKTLIALYEEKMAPPR